MRDRALIAGRPATRIAADMLANMPVLECRDLHKSYGALTVLDGVSFDVEAGEVLAIAGPNGAGKTTLLTIIAGITDADSGTIDLHGRRLGWVPQRAATYGKLTVRENLELFARLERVPDRDASVTAMLELIGLAGRAQTRAEQLSGGMRQRLSIGVGLVADPAVLLLDEPSAALDPLQRVRIWEFLSDLAEQGIAIVFSTHTGQEVEGHAERVMVLDRSRIIFDGPPGEITGPERLRDHGVKRHQRAHAEDGDVEEVEIAQCHTGERVRREAPDHQRIHEPHDLQANLHDHDRRGDGQHLAQLGGGRPEKSRAQHGSHAE